MLVVDAVAAASVAAAIYKSLLERVILCIACTYAYEYIVYY